MINLGFERGTGRIQLLGGRAFRQRDRPWGVACWAHRDSVGPHSGASGRWWGRAILGQFCSQIPVHPPPMKGDPPTTLKESFGQKSAWIDREGPGLTCLKNFKASCGGQSAEAQDCMQRREDPLQTQSLEMHLCKDFKYRGHKMTHGPNPVCRHGGCLWEKKEGGMSC